MDSEATNYDAVATHEPMGMCVYPGDFNGDGVVSVQDILLFLTWV